MAQSAVNVIAGAPLVTGGILTAVKGTALPTNETTALNAAFKALGYAGEGGLEPSGDAASLKDIVAWGGDIVATLSESKSITRFKAVLIETMNADVNKYIHGAGNVTVTAAVPGTSGTKLAILDKGEDLLTQPFVFDMKYQGKKARIVAPLARGNVLSELAWTDSDLTGYEVEWTCLPDSSGVRVYRYYANDDF
jgi:hypothetical protein